MPSASPLLSTLLVTLPLAAWCGCVEALPARPDHARDMSQAVDMSQASDLDARTPCEAPPEQNARGFQAGRGDDTSPYLICTLEQLKLIDALEREALEQGRPRGHAYALGRSIEMDDTWSPIGCFRGTLDGQKHTLSGLRVTSWHTPRPCDGTAIAQGGLIDQARGAEVRDVTFQDVALGSSDAPLPDLHDGEVVFAGAIFGQLLGSRLGSIRLRDLDADITRHFGGLAAFITDSELSDVGVIDAVIRARHDRIGGLAYLIEQRPGELVDGEEENAWRPSFKEVAFQGSIASVSTSQGSRCNAAQSCADYGLLASRIRGTLDLEGICVSGVIRLADLPEDTISARIGALAGWLLLPPKSEEDQEEAPPLSRVRLRQSVFKDIELLVASSRTVGGLVGRLGQDEGGVVEFQVSQTSLGPLRLRADSSAGYAIGFIHVMTSFAMTDSLLHSALLERPKEPCRLAQPESRRAEATISICRDNLSCNGVDPSGRGCDEQLDATFWDLGNGAELPLLKHERALQERFGF